MKELTSKLGPPERCTVHGDCPDRMRKVVAEYGAPLSTWGILCPACWEDMVVFIFQKPSGLADIQCRGCSAMYYLNVENGVLLDVKQRNSVPASCLVRVDLNLSAGAVQDP